MWYFTEFWRARTTLKRFRQFLAMDPFFPDFFFLWCQVPLGNLTVWFDPNLPSSRGIDFLGWESWDTQPNCIDSFYKTTDPSAPPVTFCWAFHLPQHVENSICCQICILSETCSFDTRVDANDCMMDFLSNGTDVYSFCLWWPVFEVFSPLRQSWPSSLVREKTIVLVVSDHLTSPLVLVSHDWKHMSLLLNIVHVPSTENTLPLSSQRRLSFLLVTAPLSTTSFRTLKFRVLIIWSMWSFTDVFNRKQLVCLLFLMVSWSYKAKTSLKPNRIL